MPDAGCNGHDERFVRLEEENRHLRERHDKVDAALERLSNAITTLTQEAGKRDTDQKLIAQIFERLQTDREEFTRLWARHDDLVEKMNAAEIRRIEADKAAEIKRLEEERNEQKNKDREFLKAVLTVAAALAAGVISKHFGF